jgi:predicted dehydrogenase
LLERRDIDIVSVATPPATRRDIIPLAAQARKHVLSEKPISTSLAEADRLIDVCRQNSVTFGLYHNYLYYPHNVLARELVEGGAIGTVVATHINSLKGRPWAGAEEYRPGWRHDVQQAGGGIMMDSGVHAIYLTETYHGHPISAVNAFLNFEGSGTDNYAFCRFHLGSAIGTLNMSWAFGSASVDIVGTEGNIEFVYDEGAGYFMLPVRVVRVHREGEPTQSHYMPFRPVFRDYFSPQLYTDYVRSITGEGPAYAAPAEAGRAAMQVAQAAYRSAADGTTVTLPIDPRDPIYAQGLSALQTAV